MPKLINFNYRETPKGVICCWEDSDNDWIFTGYIIPKFIITAIFDDGTMRISGINGIRDFNQLCKSHIGLRDQLRSGRHGVDYDLFDLELDGLLCYDEFTDFVDLDMAKGFVQWNLYRGYESEELAKQIALEDIKSSGIEISSEALEYLNHNNRIPKHGDIIRITHIYKSAMKCTSKLKEGDICEVVSSWECGSNIFVRVRYPDGNTKSTPLRSTSYVWEIVDNQSKEEKEDAKKL